MKYKCVIFDLDGTIYFGNKLAFKANEVVSKARTMCEKIFFITNNSAKTREQIYTKLIDLGLNVQPKEIMTTSYAITKYLKNNNYNKVYCIGTKHLKEQLEKENIITNSKEPEIIVVGYNQDFKLSDLDELANINTQNSKLLVANKERNYPKENGYIFPGAGPIVSAVETLLNKETDFIIGKPNIEMINIAVNDYGFNPNEILVVGDSYESDIKMAQAYGADSILISKEKKNDCQCIEKLADLLEILK